MKKCNTPKKSAKPIPYQHGGKVKTMKARGGGAATRGLKFTRNG